MTRSTHAPEWMKQLYARWKAERSSVTTGDPEPELMNDLYG